MRDKPEAELFVWSENDALDAFFWGLLPFKLSKSLSCFCTPNTQIIILGLIRIEFLACDDIGISWRVYERFYAWIGYLQSLLTCRHVHEVNAKLIHDCCLLPTQRRKSSYLCLRELWQYVVLFKQRLRVYIAH